MHLYAGTSTDFVEDATLNRIGAKIAEAWFEHFRYEAPKGEVAAWKNSLQSMANAVQHGSLDDHGVIVEYSLPLSSKRLDVMLTGSSRDGRRQAVIVELKQWSESFPTHVDECVVTFVGGRKREVLHPSAQVDGYRQYLKDTHSAFSDGAIGLSACSFLHNMTFDEQDEIFSARHLDLIQVAPVFTGDRTTDLIEYLQDHLSGGGGVPVLESVLSGRYAPHKKLLAHTAQMIKGEPAYVLLDEQRVVFNSVLAQVAEAHRTAEKAVFVIKGGPGTGKSVIALNLVGELSEAGYVTHHATGSRAFTENVRRIVGRRAANLFKYFNSYLGADANTLDVLVCDEAHRIREVSHNRFTPKAERTDEPQVKELIDVAKVSVFLLDDLQVVRPGETGSTGLIREAAGKFDAEVFEYELEAQFRCGGSEGFIQWVDNTLDIVPTPHVLWSPEEEFDFDVVDSPAELEALINQKEAQGHSARLVAGFCWPWSDPLDDGALVDDVVIDDWNMPWNAKPDATGLAEGIPKSHYWANQDGGLNQVGCVYTAQGFEFDYAGVIFGRDLVYRPREGWVGQPEFSHDAVVKRAAKEGDFTDLVKQTYRVLLTRGMKGCYVYFQDDATRDFWLSRVDMSRQGHGYSGESKDPDVPVTQGLAARDLSC
jgi:hypothetical protein